MEYLKAFAVGGTICLVGQLLIDRTKLTPARILVGFVVAGVVLTASAMQITSTMKHLLAKGARAAVAKGGLLGAFTGGLSAASGGITASVMLALAAAALFKPKEK